MAGEDDLTKLSHEEAMLKSYWDDVLKHVSRDLGSIWTEEVRHDFENMKDEAKRIALILGKLYEHHKLDRQRYAKEISDINQLLSHLNNIESKPEWVKKIDEELQKVIKGLDDEYVMRKRQLEAWGFPAEQDPQLAGFLIKHWDKTKQIAKSAGDNVTDFFRSLPAAREMIDEKTLPKIADNMSETARVSSRRSFLKKICLVPIAAAFPALTGCKEEEIRFPKRPISKGPAKFLILDSGHGGETTGTVYNEHNIKDFIGRFLGSNEAVMKSGYNLFKNSLLSTVKGACEDEVAYDVLCRVVKRDRGEERVIPLIKDEKTGYEPIKNLLLSLPNKDEYIVIGEKKTKIGDAVQGIRERIRAVNRYYELLVGTGIRDEDIYFVSIHADSAPTGARGAFSIYPVARADYGGVSANQKSRMLEERLRERLKRQGIKTRVGYEEGDYGNSKGLFKAMPKQKVILEIGNMSDLEDYTRLNDARYREKLAEAIYTLIL